MSQYQSNGRLLAFSILQCLIPSMLLITTPKRSVIRYLSIPCMIWIVYHMMYPVQNPGYTSTNFLGSSATFVLTALDLLLINPQAGHDFVDANGHAMGFFSRLVEAVRLVTCARAVNTPRQVKNVPPSPEYYTKRDPKFLALDIFSVLASRQAMNEQDENISGRALVEHAIQSLIAWLVVTRILLSFYYRVASIVFVSLGDSPANSPPIIGRMADIYTLRNYWGEILASIVTTATYVN
ncbi:hypothetical protein N7497_010473 [Penicillium chrysogenum]|nr:hypothetical protein N7497_010473 [Penicillium chrysogenum]